MTSHPLYMTPYRGYFCNRIHSIDDITPTVFMRSHLLYKSTLYPLYTTTYSLYLYHHSHCICVSHPLVPWYHTLCIYDIAPTIYLTSDTLYKVSHPQFMTLCHIIYDIACTVFMSSRLPHPWVSPGKNTGVGCHSLLQCMKVKDESEVAQSCLTLSDPMDCSLPGSSVQGIFQARVLEWGAIAFSDCGSLGIIKSLS